MRADMAQAEKTTSKDIAPKGRADTTNVLIVGVGGQGVIMVSRVMARIGQLQGFDVKQSEVHGMAKRGGVVFSHVRFGPTVWSPTIPKGKVDILVALEWAERGLPATARHCRSLARQSLPVGRPAPAPSGWTDHRPRARS